MGWYRVCLNTIVRKDVKLDSERLRILPMGSRVNVVQKKGRRVMIDQPIKGWCSLSSSNGDTILKPLSDDTAAQTPRSSTEAQSAHYKQEAAKARGQAQKVETDEDKKKLEQKAAQYDALAAQVVAQKKAHEQELESLSKAATSTNVDSMLFRDGDVIQLTKKNHDNGIVIVRTTIEVDGKEWIGVDYGNDSTPYLPALNGTHPDTKDQVHFTAGENMRGGWVSREEVTGFLTGGSIVPQLNTQVLENQVLTSTLAALKTIIKELDKTEFPGLANRISDQARFYEQNE